MSNTPQNPTTPVFNTSTPAGLSASMHAGTGGADNNYTQIEDPMGLNQQFVQSSQFDEVDVTHSQLERAVIDNVTNNGPQGIERTRSGATQDSNEVLKSDISRTFLLRTLFYFPFRLYLLL